MKIIKMNHKVALEITNIRISPNMVILFNNENKFAIGLNASTCYKIRQNPTKFLGKVMVIGYAEKREDKYLFPVILNGHHLEKQIKLKKQFIMEG